MRVLQVYRTYFPETQGGLEEVIRQTSLGTQALGATNRILTLSSRPADDPIKLPEGDVFQAKKHIEIASCGMSFSGFSLFGKLADWADIIHYHHPWPFADMLHLLRRINKPTVLTYHSDIVRQRLLSVAYSPLQKRFLGNMDRIICTSPNYFATSETLARFQEKVEVIPIGLERDAYPDPPAGALPIANGRTLDLQKPYFLFVGVLRYYKGLHILLDALKGGADYQVVIVGSGPTEKELKEQAATLGLTNVIFTGQVSDEQKVQLIQSSRGIVFPSYLRSEAFGVTLLEGAMFGRPLISTEVGSGTSHVNLHDVTGLVVAPGSARSLRRALDALYENPEKAERMGGQARLRYERLFTGKLMARRYYRIYQDVLQGAGPTATTRESSIADRN